MRNHVKPEIHSKGFDLACRVSLGYLPPWLKTKQFDQTFLTYLKIRKNKTMLIRNLLKRFKVVPFDTLWSRKKETCAWPNLYQLEIKKYINSWSNPISQVFNIFSFSLTKHTQCNDSGSLFNRLLAVQHCMLDQTSEFCS